MLTPLHPTDPAQVGPYQLHGRLGAGGMGTVYQGFSPDGRAVAIKLPHESIAADAEFRSRFRQEVAAARRVRGGFVAEVLDADVDVARPWMATEYVDGVSLTDAIRRRGPLEGSAILGLAVGLADALVAIHAAGIVHRDLKPSNVIMAWDGPKVIDFGIAHTADAANRTATGVLVGTVAWMAPEQLAGDRASPAADVFAWAACISFAATGRNPFAAESQAATVGRILGGEPDLHGLTGSLDEVVRRSMAKRPDARPTATELVATITGRAVVDARDAEDAATHFVRGTSSWPRHPAGPLAGSNPPWNPTRVETDRSGPGARPAPFVGAPGTGTPPPGTSPPGSGPYPGGVPGSVAGGPWAGWQTPPGAGAGGPDWQTPPGAGSGGPDWQTPPGAGAGAGGPAGPGGNSNPPARRGYAAYPGAPAVAGYQAPPAGYGSHPPRGYPQPGAYGRPAPYGPPPPYPRSPVPGRAVRTYLWQSIVVLLMCWPTGIPAVVYASQVGGRQRSGDLAGALHASKKAKFWCIVSGVLSLASWAILIAIAVNTDSTTA